ncbi:MAG: hypothetical protein ABW220_00230 [Burkholderiaceae bacterium]
MSVSSGGARTRTRTLSVSSPAIPTVLGAAVPEQVRLFGQEDVNALFTYELLLKTPDALSPGASGARIGDHAGRKDARGEGLADAATPEAELADILSLNAAPREPARDREAR